MSDSIFTDKPLVSIITVTYNSEAYIRDTIESILNLSYTNFELIISDDTSTDRTWEIIQEFSDSRITAIQNKSNLGEYKNRNQALKLTTGKYLIFIDGDDIIYPHGLDYLVKMMEGFPDCNMALMYPYDERVIYPITVTPRQYYLNIFFGKGLLDVSFTNTFYRRKALLEINGITTKFSIGDYFTNFKIASFANTLIVGDHCTWWRISKNQASQRILKKPAKAFKENLTINNYFLNFSNCPLLEHEKELARINIGYKLKMSMLKCLKQFQLGHFIRLALIANSIPIAIYRIIFIRPITDLDPFYLYNGERPYRIEFNRNPFSINYLNIIEGP